MRWATRSGDTGATALSAGQVEWFKLDLVVQFATVQSVADCRDHERWTNHPHKAVRSDLRSNVWRDASLNAKAIPPFTSPSRWRRQCPVGVARPVGLGRLRRPEGGVGIAHRLGDGRGSRL